MIMINLFALFLNALYLIALFNVVASSSRWEVVPSYLWEVAPSSLWEVTPSRSLGRGSQHVHFSD